MRTLFEPSSGYHTLSTRLPKVLGGHTVCALRGEESDLTAASLW
jgi:hypothetical protein